MNSFKINKVLVNDIPCRLAEHGKMALKGSRTVVVFFDEGLAVAITIFLV